MSIISNVIYPPDILNIGGYVAIAILTVLLSISFIISETKYCNTCTRNNLELVIKALILIFITIVIFKISQIMSGIGLNVVI